MSQTVHYLNHGNPVKDFAQGQACARDYFIQALHSSIHKILVHVSYASNAEKSVYL